MSELDKQQIRKLRRENGRLTSQLEACQKKEVVEEKKSKKKK